MLRPNAALVRSLGVVFVCALSSPVWSQQASGIAGAVTDSSGAVMPGVTVEASSPALIEKVRSVTTAADGRYNIVDLRPGTYTVTFTLPGFNTYRREGIELTVGFTATVSAALQVGALEETITVSGASPLVDTQNVRQQQVLSNELLTALPNAVAGISTLSKLVPGLRSGGADVGAASGLYMSNAFSRDTYHGKSGMKLTYNDMQVNNLTGTGGNTSYAVNFATVQETAVETGGVSAESDANNVRVNLVPKEGGNSHSGETTYFYTNNHLQSENLTRRFAVARRHEHQQSPAPQRSELHDRRAGREEQGLVLRGIAVRRHQESGAGHLLQQHARHTVLHAGPGSAGIQGLTNPQPGRPNHLAGDTAAEGERISRRAAIRSVGRRRQQSAGSANTLGLLALETAAGHLDFTADQQVAARGGFFSDVAAAVRHAR